MLQISPTKILLTAQKSPKKPATQKSQLSENGGLGPEVERDQTKRAPGLEETEI